MWHVETDVICPHCGATHEVAYVYGVSALRCSVCGCLHPPEELVWRLEMGAHVFRHSLVLYVCDEGRIKVWMNVDADRPIGVVAA